MYKIQFYIMVLSIKWKKLSKYTWPYVSFFGKLGSISLATPRPDYCQTC